MKNKCFILTACFILYFSPFILYSQPSLRDLHFDFYGDPISLKIDMPVETKPAGVLSSQSVKNYFSAINNTNYKPLITALLFYKAQYKLDDWLYYQLIRKTVQLISPKAENYERYTVYKWFLLTSSGYGATLKTGNGQLMFYVQTDEEIFNLPYYMRNGKQYVCLNYHDYNHEGSEKDVFTEVDLAAQGGIKSFTYKVTQLPNFSPGDYIEKDLRFNFYQDEYHFKVKMNSQIKNIFANYPVVNCASYFNIPLSSETYQSLIPSLKKNTKGMNIKNGVDYLMRFTRYAFLFETDTKNFGQEKRLSPEQTLLFDQSDCEDRAALFFCLVKEIYNLPMIVLAFPKHVTIAVKFDKPVGKPIMYNGSQYSVCDPTPQSQDLSIGNLLPAIKKTAYEVVYAYNPADK